MNDQQDSGSPDSSEDEKDPVPGDGREDERDEAIREGLARDDELAHAIDQDDEE